MEWWQRLIPLKAETSRMSNIGQAAISSFPHTEIKLSYLLFSPGERTSHERIPHNVYSWWPLIPYISRLIVAWRRDLAFSRFSSYRNHIWYHSSRSERLGIMNCHFLSMRVP